MFRVEKKRQKSGVVFGDWYLVYEFDTEQEAKDFIRDYHRTYDSFSDTRPKLRIVLDNKRVLERT